MHEDRRPSIVVIDDNREQLRLMERFLTGNGFAVVTADNGQRGIDAIHRTKPDLILLDVMMPGMDGYEVCARLQKDKETAFIPVIFITALGEQEDRARAFALGAVDYLTKPLRKKDLLNKVQIHLKTNSQWQQLQKGEALGAGKGDGGGDFQGFKRFLFERIGVGAGRREELASILPFQVYALARPLGISNAQLAKYIAEFLKLPYIDQINPDDVRMGVLPIPFCRANLVVPLKGGHDYKFAISNPFNWEVIDNLKKIVDRGRSLVLAVAEPEQIELLFKSDICAESPDKKREVMIPKDVSGPIRQFRQDETIEEISDADIKKHPIVYIANTMLNKAVAERASDIHIEPKDDETVIRFRVDGDLRDAFAVKKNTGVMLISRLKVLGGLDLAEKRKPQDGSFAATINNRTFKLRLATTSTPHGESLIIRLLEPTARPKGLGELGMTEDQVNTMIEFANRTHGVIMIVGPTGSGKTTTIYSFLSHIDCRTRSLISVEDPVEYTIPFANQQQANEKAGITFESLLKSAVRQDPDILFLGEIRDPYSAKLAIDFASTGHLTVTSLHTSNATTAIFRLERLGIDRGTIADTLIGVVAQRLIKRLCPECKEIAEISDEEREMFAPFTDDIPRQVAHPAGCPKCNHTGYFGREGVYEIIKFDHQIAEMARGGASIAEIRNAVRNRGDFLISTHAIEKVRRLVFAPRDVYEQVLVEELAFEQRVRQGDKRSANAQKRKREYKGSILVVEDDRDSRILISRFLEKNGYAVTQAEDGISALLYMGCGRYDLIISDVNMPNLNGFKLLEMKGQKGIDTPVIFLTARSEPEDIDRGLSLGAAGYITKPTKKEILLSKVQDVLQKGAQRGG